MRKHVVSFLIISFVFLILCLTLLFLQQAGFLNLFTFLLLIFLGTLLPLYITYKQYSINKKKNIALFFFIYLFFASIILLQTAVIQRNLIFTTPSNEYHPLEDNYSSFQLDNTQ